MLHHHEKLNEPGYPYGLQVRELSTGGRIVALADIVSAPLACAATRQASKRSKLFQAFLDEEERFGRWRAGVIYNRA